MEFPMAVLLFVRVEIESLQWPKIVRQRRRLTGAGGVAWQRRLLCAWRFWRFFIARFFWQLQGRSCCITPLKKICGPISVSRAIRSVISRYEIFACLRLGRRELNL